MKRIVLFTIAALVISSVPVSAQHRPLNPNADYRNQNRNNGYTVYQQGRQPSQVVPNNRGGYTVYGPDQQPSQIQPNSRGGYTIYTPGQPPSQVYPNNRYGR